MALTYGFYNSIEGDRKYDATQVSRIFDGIIKDGVYATYEKALMVIASENAGEVIIQPGRAWFNHTWSYNDANLIMQAPAPEVLLDRIDALVLEVNEELAVRANSFKWVQGTPSSSPENPTLTNTSTVHQYPLCYIHRYPETTMIYTRDITNMIGTSECPFVTGVLEGIDLDAWINQWDNEFHNWENTTKTSFETWMLNQESTYTAWETAMKAQMADDIEDVEEWVETIRNIIDAETATHLQNEIDELRSEITAGSHIIISTSETELFGREVTITTEEGVILTEEFDSNGVADFKSVPYVGNLTVSSSYGTETAERIISTPYYARYTFTLAFWSATVNIVGDPELAGQTVTIKDSELVIVGTVVLDSEGEGVFTATRPDTYLFTLTYGGETMEVTLSVTQETTYTVELHAQGSVNLADWLTAGSTTEHPINPSSYPTFADVEADEEVVRQLMTVHNAVDYLATSDGTDELIGQVINSDICAKWINLRDYALDTLSANVAVKALMDTADKYGYGEWALMPQVPKMTSNTAPYGVASASDVYQSNPAYYAFDGSDSTAYVGNYTQTDHWLSYKFTEPKCIKRFSVATVGGGTRTTRYKLQGSNDDFVSDIHDLTDVKTVTSDVLVSYDVTNNDSYTSYRLAITMDTNMGCYISTFQLYSYQPKGNVPIMTSNTAPYGEVITTASWLTGDNAPYQAFANNGNNAATVADTSSASICYKFVNPVRVRKIAVKEINTYNSYMVDSSPIIEYSNDGTTFTEVQSISISGTDSAKLLEFNINNDVFALYWRLRWTSYNYRNTNSGHYNIYVNTLQFYGRELSVSVPTMTSNTAPYGEAIIETISGSSPTTYPVWRAFDGDESTNNGRFNSYSSSVYTLAFGYDFKKPVCIKYVRNVGYLGDVGVTVNATIQGSNDGTNWTDLGEIQLASTSLTVTQTTLNNTDNFRYYRIVGTAVKTGNYYYVCTQELQFYGLDYSEREFAEGSTMKYIYDHGVELEELTEVTTGSDSLVTRETDHIKIYVPASVQRIAAIYKNMDLSDYDIAKVKYGKEYMNGVYLSVFSQVPNYAQTGGVAHSGTGQVLNSVLNNLDISSLNGTYYIANQAANNSGAAISYTDIDEWWLE